MTKVSRGEARTKGAFALSLVVAFGLCALEARAQEPPAPRGGAGPVVGLVWRVGEGAEGCMAREALAQAIEARLERSIFSDAEGVDYRVEGEISARAPRGYRVLLRLLDGQGVELGRREILSRARRCGELDGSLPLVVALMLDIPGLREEPIDLPEPPDPAVVARSTAPPPRASAGSSSAPAIASPIAGLPNDTTRDLHLYASAGPTFAVGLLPSLAAGLALRAGVELEGLSRLGVEARVWSDQRATRAGAGVALSLVHAGLHLCTPRLEPIAGRLGIDVCAEGLVAWTRSDGFGLERVQSEAHFTFLVGGRVGVALALSESARIELGALLGAPLERVTYLYRELGGVQATLHQDDEIAAIFDLSLELRP